MLTWSAKDTSRLFQDLEGDGGRSIGPTGGTTDAHSFSSSTYEYLRDRNDVFSETMAVTGNMPNANLALSGRAESALVQGVSGNFFRGIGVPAYLGRTILPEDDRGGASAVGVLSYSFWQTRL